LVGFGGCGLYWVGVEVVDVWVGVGVGGLVLVVCVVVDYDVWVYDCLGLLW